MSDSERRSTNDRRRVARGGRRAGDQPGRHPRVLIAEPYDGVRRQCVRYLDLFHFNTDEVADAAGALAASQQALPALVVADLALVTAEGGRLALGLAADGRTQHIRVIGLADVEDDAKRVARLPQVAGILVKPFRLSAMLEEVRRVLRQTKTSEDVAGL